MIRKLFVRDCVVKNVGGQFFVTKNGGYTCNLKDAKRFTEWGGERYVRKFKRLSLSLKLSRLY